MIEWIYQTDRAVMEWVQSSLSSAWLDHIMIFITKLGDAGFIWILGGIILLCFKKTRRCGVVLLAAVALNFLIGDLIVKPLVSRARPFIDDPAFELLISPPHGYSFPSGHSGSSSAAAVVLTAFYRKRGAFAFLLAGGIAFSRMYLYVHYPTDVLTGCCLGVCVGLLTVWVYRRWEQSRRKE